MPGDNLLVRINHVPYSWTSTAHFFSGLPYKGITAVTFKETRELKLVHAAQQDGTPLGLTAGIYKVENLSFTMLRLSAATLMADLTILGLGSYGDAEFNYLLQTFEPVVPPQPPISTLISGIRITGVEEKQEVGSDELVTEFTCQALSITRVVAGAVPLQLYSLLRGLLI